MGKYSPSFLFFVLMTVTHPARSAPRDLGPLLGVIRIEHTPAVGFPWDRTATSRTIVSYEDNGVTPTARPAPKGGVSFEHIEIHHKFADFPWDPTATSRTVILSEGETKNSGDVRVIRHARDVGLRSDRPGGEHWGAGGGFGPGRAGLEGAWDRKRPFRFARKNHLAAQLAAR